MRTHITSVALLLILLFCADPLFAQRGPGRGFVRGFGRGPGLKASEQQHPGRGHEADQRHAEDHEIIQFLLTSHEKIRRTVTDLPNGVETLTESDDPDVAAHIKGHVDRMQYRVEETLPVRMRDPLFAKLFRHTDEITMQHEETEHGVRVIATSDNPRVAQLIRAHARVVSGFVEHGFAEAMKNHPVPDAAPPEAPAYTHPVISDYGRVVRLPQAAHQPQPNSRIVVDVTQGSDPNVLNPAFDKVARFVNIYGGAGAEPARASIVIVLHGGATLTILNDDAYAARFGTETNPNLDCLHQLHKAGVEIFVCGQSLIGKDATPDDVIVFADVAVSALTALVNLQSDGFVRIPLDD